MSRTVKKTPLDGWFEKNSGLEATKENIEAYQLRKLNETLAYIRAKSPFYRRLLAGYEDRPLSELSQLGRLPFTTPAQLAGEGENFLCVGQEEVARIVTLSSSGTTALTKRVYFAKEDQDLTVDFFAWGMRTFVGRGDKVLILMPGERPGTVGELLSRALRSFGAIPLLHGLPASYQEVLASVEREKPANLVAAPQTAAALSCLYRQKPFKSPFNSILLSADFGAKSLENNLSGLWGCPVYQHYGMTETGLGGGVYCQAEEGYHLRSCDLYFEVIEPQTGEAAAPGVWGEVVFTTLNRLAMPLLRYRTGDWGLFSAGPCPCGSQIPRLQALGGRIADSILLKGGPLSPAILDELIFSLPEIGGYEAGILFDGHKCRLELEIYAPEGLSSASQNILERAVAVLPALAPYFIENRCDLVYTIKRELPLPEKLKKQAIRLL